MKSQTIFEIADNFKNIDDCLCLLDYNKREEARLILDTCKTELMRVIDSLNEKDEAYD